MALSSDERRRRRLYGLLRHLSEDANLDREGRLDLARYVFRNEGYEEITSFSDLDTEHLEQLRAILTGWRDVQLIRLYHGTLHDEAKVILERHNETAQQSAERQDSTGSWR